MDIIIKNGRIIDGTGNPWFKADLAIEGGKIIDIGVLDSLKGEKVINAKGLVICPGFIDIHSHADSTNLVHPQQESTIRQGITTIIGGNCGYGLAPINHDKKDLILKYLANIIHFSDDFKIDWSSFGEYLTKIEKVGMASNMILLLGHGTMRISVMGFDDREPTDEELAIMKNYTTEAMEVGALGLSTGLFYPPGIFAKTEEIIELCKIVSEYNGYYFSHIRSYGPKLMKSIRETIKIGKKAYLPVQVSHLSIFGKPFWGTADTVLNLIEKARDKGLEINCDMHPYDSVMTGLEMLLPPWVFEGGIIKTLERLKDPETREKIKYDQLHGCEGWDEWFPIEVIGWENILPVMLHSEKYKPHKGKNFKEISEIFQMDLFDTVYDLMIEEEGEASMIITHLRGEEDITNFMKSNLTAFETDGSSVAPYGKLAEGNPHPRFYGTYPKILGEFVREKKVLTLETAIRKSTSLPAQMVGLLDRGLLKPGRWADIVIFDPKTVIDKSTYANPHQYPIGINYVIVNGKIVLENGERVDILPGKVLRHEK